jgi:hypothetical protein
MRLLLVAFAGLVLVGAADPIATPRSPEAQAVLDKWLSGRIAGERRACVPDRVTYNPIGVDDHTVLFRDGPRIWRNDVRIGIGCGNIGKRQTTVMTEHGVGRICNGNRLEFTYKGVPSVCELGDFVVYKKP